MRLRFLVAGGLLFSIVHCGTNDSSKGGGGPADAGEAGEAGSATSGAAGTQGGSSGSGQGGASGSGQAGEEQGGSSGKAGSTGNGGTTGGGAGESGAAGAGGQDDGRGSVSGYVRMFYGPPIEGAVVAIGDATTTTDETGFFEIADVAPTYDAVMIQSAENYALVVRGVSSRTLNLFGAGYPDIRSATIEGIVTGGAGVPIAPDRAAYAAYVGPNFGASQPALLRAIDASYSIQASWVGPSSNDGTLYAIEYEEDSGGHVTVFNGVGAKPISVSDGGSFGSRDGAAATTIQLSPVNERNVGGTLSVPSGYEPLLWFSVGPFLTDYIDIPPGPYSTVLPTGSAILDNFVQVHAERTTTNGTEVSETTYVIADSTSTLDLTTPAAATCILPVAAAVGVDHDTIFSWDPADDSVSSVHFDLGTWMVTLVTASSSSTIPDLTDYGIGLPPAGPGTWYVESTLGPSSVDEWLVSEADPDAYLEETGRRGWAFGLERTFTLAD